MSRNLILAVAAFIALSASAIWNGRQLRETLGQVEFQVAGANEQRIEMWRSNAGFTSTEGRPRVEDSVLALAERLAPWMVSSPPALAGLAVGQAALRDVVWRPTSWGAEPSLEIFDNAQTMAAGHFDLALVIVFALPLLMLFAPRNDSLLLILGPIVSLVGIVSSGAPLASADTWLRGALWMLLTAVYGYLWLMLRDRVSSYWITGVVYIALVAVIPGLAVLLPSLLVPPPSRVVLAERSQAALRPVMDKTSRELAPFYESHPEFVDEGHTPAEYDRVRLQAEAEMHAATAPLLAEANATASTHRMMVKALSFLSPASIMHLALLETAGTGVSRQEAFEASAEEFGKTWADAVKAAISRSHPIRQAEIGQMPRFKYTEQSLMSWLLPAGLGLVGLLGWFGLLTTRKKLI